MQVTCSHIDTCLSSFLQDHHNRPGELLLGVYVDGNSTMDSVRQALHDEFRQSGDRIESDEPTDADCAAAIDDAFIGHDPAKLFDSSLEVIDEEEAETMGGDEMPQAWFLLQWEAEEE